MYRSKYRIVCLGVLLLTIGISACSSGNLTESQSSETGMTLEDIGTSGQESDSPENAIKEYLAGLRDNDMERMLDTFADNGYLLETPPDVDQSITANHNEDNVVDDILRQYIILCNMEIDIQKPMSLSEEGEAEKLYHHLCERIQVTDFSSMKLLGFITQELLIDAVGSDHYKSYMELMAERFEADKVESRECIMELDGNKYVLNFDVAEADGKWQILRLGGYFATMSKIDNAAAGTVRMDAEDEREFEQEFERLIVPAGDLPPAAGNMVGEHVTVWESDGFDTPHEAVMAYLEGIKAGELDIILSSFAIESYVDHYDMQQNLEYTKGYIFMKQSFDLPAVNTLSREFNIRTRKRKIIEEIAAQYQALSFINGEYYGNASVTDEKESEDIQILGYIPPEDLTEVYVSEANKEHLEQLAQRCGAEQVAGSLVVFELQGNRYFLCADVIKYNGRWYTWQLGGLLANYLDIHSSLKGTWVFESMDGAKFESFMIPME